MRLWGTLALAPVVLLAACGGYAPVTYPPVPVTNYLTMVHGNRHLAAADKASFTTADFSYPTRGGGGFHKVPVGDYLLAQLIQQIPETVETKRIKLETFGSVCKSGGGFGPHAICQTALIVRIETAAGERLVESNGAYDVGPMFIPGDISPPFTMGDHLVGVIHGEAMTAVLAAVADWKRNAGY